MRSPLLLLTAETAAQKVPAEDGGNTCHAERVAAGPAIPRPRPTPFTR